MSYVVLLRYEIIIISLYALLVVFSAECEGLWLLREPFQHECLPYKNNTPVLAKAGLVIQSSMEAGGLDCGLVRQKWLAFLFTAISQWRGFVPTTRPRWRHTEFYSISLHKTLRFTSTIAFFVQVSKEFPSWAVCFYLSRLMQFEISMASMRTFCTHKHWFQPLALDKCSFIQDCTKLNILVSLVYNVKYSVPAPFGKSVMDMTQVSTDACSGHSTWQYNLGGAEVAEQSHKFYTSIKRHRWLVHIHNKEHLFSAVATKYLFNRPRKTREPQGHVTGLKQTKSRIVDDCGQLISSGREGASDLDWVGPVHRFTFSQVENIIHDLSHLK